jgi:aspartyl-tRNA(Asn)/glutamyl-tRNA(Gln) amidotransferase subunit C
VGVSPDAIRHVAGLAALALEDEEITGLTAQLNGILDHMRALESAVAGLDGFDEPAGEAPLRPDEPGADPLAAPPARMAPGWVEDYFTVPQLASHVESDPTPDSAAENGP